MRNKFVLLSLFLALHSPFAFAEGGSGSHAGGFVTCHDPKTYAPVSFELADLYEGRTKWGLHYSYVMNGGYAGITSRQILVNLRANLPEKFGSHFDGLLGWFDQKFAKSGAKIVDQIDYSPDVQELLASLNLPPECEFIQSASFLDRNNELTWSWSPLEKGLGLDYWNPNDYLVYSDPTTRILSFEFTAVSESRSANYVLELKTHEVIYKLARELAHDTTSRRTRRIVGLLFSDEAVGPSQRGRQSETTQELTRLLDDLLGGRPYIEAADPEPSPSEKRRR